MVETNQDMQNIMNNKKRRLEEALISWRTWALIPNDEILASIASFNVFLLGELLLWKWFEIDAAEELLCVVDWSVWDGTWSEKRVRLGQHT